MENEINIRRVFLYTLITSVAVSALIGIGVILFGDFGSFEIRILMTTLTVTATSILGLACGAYLETGRGRKLPLSGIIFSIIAAIMTLFIIWDFLDDSQLFVKSATTAMLLALSLSHLSLLSLARLDKHFAWSRIATFISIALLVAVLLFLLWAEPEGSSDFVSRTIGVLSILVAAGTVITPVFHKLSANEDEAAEIDSEIEKLKIRIADLEAKRVTIFGNAKDV